MDRTALTDANLRLQFDGAGDFCARALQVGGNAAFFYFLDGLTSGEEQPLMLMIPADAVSGIETVKTVEFDMRLVNAETEEEIVTLPASARMQ